MTWKKGRGKLGIFEPLLGTWEVKTDSDLGPVHVTRVFTKSLGGKYVELRAQWTFKNSQYQELALFGTDIDKKVKFWSFTSDGKNSKGEMAEATDIHPQAIGFEAQMPAGLARQVYWPDSEHGFFWIVESRTKKGWNRFVEHHYVPQPVDGQ